MQDGIAPSQGSSEGPSTGTEWQALSREQTVEALGTRTDKGLGVPEAARRLAAAGESRLSEAPPRSPLAVLLAQFKSVFTLVLAAAAVIAGLEGDLKDAVVILTVVVLNAALGFCQEYRAERSLLALRRMLPRKARVRRDGTVQAIPAETVVPGDILLVEAGEKVAADGRVVLSAGLQVDESGLTGEFQPVVKDDAACFLTGTPLADQRNMAFMNTVVTRGRGEIAVTATGMATSMGRLSHELAEAREPRSPLQLQLDAAGKRLGLIALALVAVLFTLALARGEGLLHLILESVSLAVAAIPEGLPVVVTITLALGMRRMARRHALVKRLARVETLGCATVICSDKTGTLTVNQITVRAFTSGRDRFSVSGDGYGTDGQIARASGGTPPDLAPLLVPAVLCNDSALRDRELIGDPTEGALLVLARCNRVLNNSGSAPLDNAERARLSTDFQDLAGRGCAAS
jgi:Ca2+-transporting ATPase